MQKITTFLWFNDQAEEAAKLYTSIFKNSKIGEITRYSGAGPRPEGMVMTVAFQLDGQEFMALNGGPEFPFTEAISLYVNCKDQAEIDELWQKLGAGGEESQCGWLKDKFGVSWQIVPAALSEMMQSGDGEKKTRMMKALLQMRKLDVAALRRAFEGK